MVKRKVFVVGLDGGSFDLLGPWINQGLLPNLKALAENGISGELESTIPPMTAPAWASFMTGKNPAKNAIYDFGTQEKEGYRYRPVNSQFRRGAALWDIIGQAGGRVGVLHVPTTYPPQPVNGVLVSDFLTPTGKRDFVYPPDMLAEIEARFGKYRLYPVPPYFVATHADADIIRFLEEYTETMVYQFQVARYLIEKLDPHFLMLHIYGCDQICHWLWHLLDVTHPQYQKKASEKHLSKIVEYFREFDAQIGKLAAMRDEDTPLFIISDHGFGGLHKVINLNVWLMQEGYLVLKPRPGTTLKKTLWKLGFTPENLAQQQWVRLTLGKLVMKMLSQPDVDKMMRLHSRSELLLSLNDVDWSRTRAFCLFGWGQIKINLRGKYAQGCVSPGAEYQNVRNEIVQKLKELRDPETGEKVGGEVYTRDEVYSGPFFDDAPDITFLPMKKRYWANSRGTGFPSNKAFSNYLWGMTGMHTMQGMLIAEGQHLRKGMWTEGAHLMDLFPSILYFMGMKIPQDTDGKVLQQIFLDEFLRENPVELTGEAEYRRSEDIAVSEEQEEEIIQRLQDLGYL